MVTASFKYNFETNNWNVSVTNMSQQKIVEKCVFYCSRGWCKMKSNLHLTAFSLVTVNKCKFCFWSVQNLQRRSQGGCWRGSSTPLSDQNIDVYFLVFHQHCTVSRDQVHCKMYFGSTTGVATHSLSNQAVMNFRDLRILKQLSSFLRVLRYHI